MKRERILRIFLVVLGLLFIALIYPLYTDLWHAKWLLEMHNETEPMFLSFFIALGPASLAACCQEPLKAHRSLIVFHGMVESGARCRNDHRNRASLESRSSSGLYGRCNRRGHWVDLAGTLTRSTLCHARGLASIAEGNEESDRLLGSLGRQGRTSFKWKLAWQ